MATLSDNLRSKMCSTLSPRLSVWIDDDGKGFLYHSLGLMDFKEKAIKWT